MSRRITLKDIADKLGCSKNTVSLALRHSPQIPPVTRERVRLMAEEMGYQPSPIVSHLMAQLRASQTPRFQAKLALVNANPAARALTDHPTIPTYVRGSEERAAQLGYAFDRFWLHDPDLSPEGFIRILTTRNIKGILLVGLMETNELPERFASVWDRFACVATGVKTMGPTLSYCCVDHHGLALHAVERAQELGYRRPALAIDDAIDQLVERRFSAGYLIGQQRLVPANRLPPFLQCREAQANRSVFRDWIERHRPDCVFSLYHSVMDWLEAMGYEIPRDIGYAQLEWRPSRPYASGMDQRNDLAGAAAVDMLITLIHHSETGAPDFPRATLISATWRDGKTAVRQTAKPVRPEAGAR